MTQDITVKNYRVTIGMKMPIPGVDYSNVNVEIAGEGPDLDALEAEIKQRTYQLLEDVIADLQA